MIASIRSHIEPGPLPRRVWFYAMRREVRAMGRGKAFVFGVCLGVIGCAGVLAVVS